MKKFDVAIIGAGPGGLTAAIYAIRSGLSVVIIEKAMIGGQASLTYEIKNFPGFVEISGMELSMKMHEQASLAGAETIYGEVVSIEPRKMKNIIKTTDEEIIACSVILSMGAKARPLGCTGEAEFIGRGVAYCAVCDGAIFRGKDVALVGGGNSAVEDAIYLSNICKSVSVINNLPSFTCQKTLLDEFNKTMAEKMNIVVYQNSVVEEVLGNSVVTGIKINNDDSKPFEIKVDGVFVAIGRIPDTSFIRNQINLDERGYVAVDNKLETNMPGIYACGDVRVKELRQIITACSDGAIAATNANTFINLNK